MTGVARRDLSRREFVTGTAVAAGVLAARPAASRQASLTAADVVTRIRANIGVPWRETTVDGIKAGNPATVVTGIAVTVMPTIDVLRRAQQGGLNLVIAHEPAFYTPGDNPGPRANDPVYLAKRSLIDSQQLVVCRLADHWQARRTNDAVVALALSLGWGPGQAAGGDGLYRVPETTLTSLAAHVRSRLGIRGGLRVLGRSDMRVRTVLVSPGTTTMASVASHRAADVVVAGEPREWEVVPYLADSWTTGAGRGLIAVGRVVSLEPGAHAAARWIRTLVPGVRVDVVSQIDPYWSPGT
jgi:putative NIF3 family GTP cyclohydrolase 1 type 2